MMHSDRKYIKTSMLTETDPYTQENNQHGGSFIVSNTYFEGTKLPKVHQNSQICGDLRIFLPLENYLKSILANLKLRF